jgi:hypothetical protein
MPKKQPWPWPNENRLARRTRIARLYRDTLHEHAPHAATELDQILNDYGQHWITGTTPALNPDEPMTATEIAAWCDTSVQSITNRIRRQHIAPAGRRGKRKTYRLTEFTPTSGNTLV